MIRKVTKPHYRVVAVAYPGDARYSQRIECQCPDCGTRWVRVTFFNEARLDAIVDNRFYLCQDCYELFLRDEYREG